MLRQDPSTPPAALQTLGKDPSLHRMLVKFAKTDQLDRVGPPTAHGRVGTRRGGPVQELRNQPNVWWEAPRVQPPIQPQ